MPPIVLKPDFELLTQEYVLVQAWKKTSSYIRYHNWFADTLALDWATVNLPSFIHEISERLESADFWENKPLRIVPAPKSQNWHIDKYGKWKPSPSDKKKHKKAEILLRPLAHVDLQEQVVATALMLCLANRIETKQGDTRGKIDSAHARRQVISYGNRLFCDAVDKELHHRWGSGKLYRSYYQDYRQFVSRPKIVAKAIAKNRKRVFVIHLDLDKFYDRVRPDSLSKALADIQHSSDEGTFFLFAEKFLQWTWHKHDLVTAQKYAQQAQISDFEKIALPQGLVASGFLANLILLSFDADLREEIGKKIESDICFEDVCRYVDDLRVVVSVEDREIQAQMVQDHVTQRIQEILRKNISQLEINPDKTEISEFGSNRRPLIPQSAKMARIQSAVSGGFDATGGLEILDAIQGLITHIPKHEADDEADDNALAFIPLSDVRDTTVLRFSAARFRKTYRSIRPLLEEDPGVETDNADHLKDKQLLGRNRKDLDEDSRVFSLGLIKHWIENPSNVRLLRIALDLYPDPKILKKILKLLQPYTGENRQPKAARQVAWYCLSELFRAGATETGVVADGECLPDGANLEEFRCLLHEHAISLAELPPTKVPWYLRQQVLLFLDTENPCTTKHLPAHHRIETKYYRMILEYLCGSKIRLNNSDYATLAILARRSFLGIQQSVELAQNGLTENRMRRIASIDLSFARELDRLSTFNTPSATTHSNLLNDPLLTVRDDLFTTKREYHGLRNLTHIVLGDGPENLLRNELSLLRFADCLLKTLQEEHQEYDSVTPWQVWLQLDDNKPCAEIGKLAISPPPKSYWGNSLYEPPDNWTTPQNRWRLQLGFLLRFILLGQPDFTESIYPTYWEAGVSTYRPATNHWYQRRYGLFSGQPAFGDDWVPITDWAEHFLLALLHWPGCRINQDFDWVTGGIVEARQKICDRIKKLEKMRDTSTRTLLLPMHITWPIRTDLNRTLRICVAQTVIPNDQHFSNTNDITFSAPNDRQKHRKHLSATLAAIERMLVLRSTHQENDGKLDWLILPELAVHPEDVRTHLFQFARRHRTLILTGLTYEKVINEKFVNSALWVIPSFSEEYGLQIQTRRQGKFNLAPEEKDLSPDLIGFPRYQWLLHCAQSESEKPLRLTTSICYDATDLAMVAKLRNESDVFAIPALNKDVKTFDHMALALHYHMFQLVIVANNGTYGGSNAYQPKKEESREKQIFHLHGQPQASIAFLEVSVSDFLNRGNEPSSEVWKSPPAGWKR